MGIRVGYVNVQGLSVASWRACCALLHHTFDYLFVAETWFVDHARHSQDRRFVTSTKLGPANRRGRHRGGIYLLGTHDAHSRVAGIVVTEYSITFSCDGRSFLGVYFPPATLSLDDLGD